MALLDLRLWARPVTRSPVSPRSMAGLQLLHLEGALERYRPITRGMTSAGRRAAAAACSRRSSCDGAPRPRGSGLRPHWLQPRAATACGLRPGGRGSTAIWSPGCWSPPIQRSSTVRRASVQRLAQIVVHTEVEAALGPPPSVGGQGDDRDVPFFPAASLQAADLRRRFIPSLRASGSISTRAYPPFATLAIASSPSGDLDAAAQRFEPWPGSLPVHRVVLGEQDASLQRRRLLREAVAASPACSPPRAGPSTAASIVEIDWGTGLLK